MLDTRIFFIMLARCASTVFTLILSLVPISLFLNPAQINSRISCSRAVRDSGRFLRGGGSRSARDFRTRGLAGGFGHNRQFSFESPGLEVYWTRTPAVSGALRRKL